MISYDSKAYFSSTEPNERGLEIGASMTNIFLAVSSSVIAVGVVFFTQLDGLLAFILLPGQVPCVRCSSYIG